MNTITYRAPGPIASRFLRSNARRRVIMGPFGSGKSVACCVEIMRRAREQAPNAQGERKTRWAIVRNTYPDLKNTTVKTWRDWWSDAFGTFSRVAPFVHHMKFPLNDGTRVDCEVIFLAMDDEADAKKFLSLELTGIYFNEVRELKRALVEAGDGRLGRYPAMKDGGPSWYGMICDATVSWTNYATGNTGAAARLKLTGSPGASCTLTFPAFHNFISVENATSVAVTIQCAGGAGVAIAAGQKALLYCDGADYHNAAPTLFPAANVTFGGQLKNVTAGSANGDAVNLLQMNNAIAAGLATITTDGTFYLTFIYEADGGETSMSGADDIGNTLTYTPGFVEVYLNGVLLSAGGANPDYAATTGTSVTGLETLAAGDIVEIKAWNVFSVADTYTTAQINALFAAPPSTGIGNVTRRPVAATSLSALVADGTDGLAVLGASHALRVVPQSGSVELIATNAAQSAYSSFIIDGSEIRLRTNGVTDALVLDVSQNADFAGTVTVNSGLTVEAGGATITGDSVVTGTLGVTSTLTTTSDATLAIGLIVKGRTSDDFALIQARNNAGATALGTIRFGATNAIDFQTGSSAATQVSVIHTASATNAVQISGSNGGNPQVYGPPGAALSLFGNAGAAGAANYVGLGGNLNGNTPASATNGQLYVGWNASGGGGEISLFNAFYTAGTSFDFRQITSSGASHSLLKLTPVTSANRWVTIAPSNGGAPQIGTSTGNLALTSGTGIIEVSHAGVPHIFFKNTSLGTDLKTFEILVDGAGSMIFRPVNDAASAITNAYVMTRGTTYNIASHTWYTSTSAGTAVQGMSLTTSTVTLDRDTVTVGSGSASRPAHLQVLNNVAAASPILLAASSGANAGIDLVTKGNGPVNIYTGTTSGVTGATNQASFDNDGNVALCLDGVSSSFGSGAGVIFIANRTAAPSGSLTGGGILYVESGALKFKGSSGTVTTVANA